ncbi:FxSxx-COOH system tetratricopeptide repeat protein [Actinacidiphila epipremni]|uniref:Tetratricopeptide repeat protein n=1 Tax=Actinacidiphila epipremni TaxID=2053013 RepID=A0ABX0ZUX9_9ACTN|nr:FxSxx-COOH system tetratricopeptide repeat protein [Actinacidiphila epipremni]NJP47823.1 tetratricopeptide repeat protein [Actinacidiphila epipremni]
MTGLPDPGPPQRDGAPAVLRIEPVVSRLRTAHCGHAYLVVVDLRGAGDGSPWPYEEEEFTFGIALDGQPGLVCEALGHPSVVLHRFGDTYGPARFLVTAVAPGPAQLRLTVSNGWGVPVRTALLHVDVRPGGPDDGPEAGPQSPVRVPLPGPRQPEPAPGAEPLSAPEPAPEPPAPDPLPGHLTLSFTGHNRAWASWIAAVLERHGVTVVLQRWDVAAGTRVADGLRDLLLAPGRVLLLLGEWYFRLGARPVAEWDDALAEVVAPHPDRFRAVALTPGDLPAAAAALHPTALWGVGAAEAERRLLDLAGIDPAPDAASPDPRGPRFPLEQPAVWGGVPRRNTRFTGREELLGELHTLFEQAQPGAGVVTLLGLSGVGKTHIATEYVYRFGTEYDAVWWVRAGQRGILRENLAGLAPALGLVTGREYGERLRAVRDALRRGEPYLRWLVVLDGADQPDDVHDLVPVGPGHVLITSQNREWGEHNSALVEVPVYSRAESVAFVRRRAPRLDEADANKLAEALGDLALALDQNAGALNDSTTPVDEYIEQLRQGADVEPGLKVAADFQMTYYTAFAILLDRLCEDRPEAVDLLRLCVYFAPGPIPTRLLRVPPGRDLPPATAALLGDPQVWDGAVGKLQQWSVIHTDPRETAAGETAAGEGGGADEVLQMHPLVHQAVRAAMPSEEQDAYARVVRRVLAAADPGRPDDARTWPAYAEIVPHLAACGAPESTEPETQVLVLDCLRYLSLCGEYGVGLHLSRQALAAWGDRPARDGSRAAPAGDHPRIWDLVHHHGNLLRATGDYAATEVSDRAAWSRLRAERGADHPDTLRAAAGLAADLRGLGRYAEAGQLSEHIARATRDAQGPDDPLTLIAYNNHAVSLRLLGRYADALDLDEATLDARRVLHGPEHRWTLLSEVACAEDLRLLGRHAAALERLGDTRDRHRAVLGADHPRTLRAGQNLALSLAACGTTGSAGELLAALLERAERVLDPAHPYTVIGRALYACHERRHGDLDLARSLGERVLGQYRSQLGDAHPFTAGALANHALVLRAAGEHGAAGEAAARALGAMADAVGPGHPWARGCALVAEGGSWDFEPLTT